MTVAETHFALDCAGPARSHARNPRNLMDKMTASVIALGIVALLLIAFFAVFRGRGKFSLKTMFGTVKAEGENPTPPKNVPGGVKISGAEAGRDITALSKGEGGVELDKVKAKGNIDATHTPGDSPPKT